MHRFIKLNHFIFYFFSLLSFSVFAAQQVKETRVWPSPEYTRITIESSKEIKKTHMMLENPDRIVVDLKEIIINDALKKLSQSVQERDPSIKGIRTAQFKPYVSRVVIDLKAMASVKVFNLKPFGSYGHRLVIDVYPSNFDPLANLLKQLEEKDSKPKDKVIDKKIAKPIIPKKELIIIAIDAGHGGEDPGAIGSRGTYEKHLTLKISKKLKAIIDKDKDMKAVLIRTNDYYVSLGKRVSKARAAKADLFVSIHADAFRKKTVRGSSVFALSEKGASSAFAKFMANKANESDLIGGVSIENKQPALARTLLDLSQSATINDSLKFGNHVLKEIKKVNKLHKKYVEQAGFAVLKAPDIPSILIETAFISNPAEEKKLLSAGYQNKMAKSIYLGIKSYLKTKPSIAFYLNNDL